MVGAAFGKALKILEVALHRVEKRRVGARKVAAHRPAPARNDLQLALGLQSNQLPLAASL